MNMGQAHDFGLVDDKGDSFEFVIEPADRGSCSLVAVLQTERGPRRTEVAAVPADLWSTVAATAVKELAAEMGEGEREKKLPTFRAGLNRLSALVGRELGVLLIALMEEGAPERVDALLHAWRELAREERWWLYSKAASPGQRPGAGWRRALFHALSETSETRSAPTDEAQKKSSGSIGKHSSQKQVAKAMPRSSASPPPAKRRSPVPKRDHKSKFKTLKAVTRSEKPRKRQKTTVR